MKKTKIINLFGGPGIGKSTTAAKIYHDLQMKGYECDLPYEFPKQIAWEDNRSQITDQLFVFAGQHRNILRSYGHVDYIILDSPILLSLVYKNLYNSDFPSNLYGKSFDSMILDVFRGYDNINFNIERVRESKEYFINGRFQTYEQSKKIDDKITDVLEENSIDYISIPQNSKLGEQIAEHIIISDKLNEKTVEV